MNESRAIFSHTRTILAGFDNEDDDTPCAKVTQGCPTMTVITRRKGLKETAKPVKKKKFRFPRNMNIDFRVERS